MGNHESIFNWSINVAYPEWPSVTVPQMNPAKGDSRFENNDFLYSTVHARHGLKTIPMISDLWALHSSLVAHLDSETVYFVMWAASSFLSICRCCLNEEKGCSDIIHAYGDKIVVGAESCVSSFQSKVSSFHSSWTPDFLSAHIMIIF